MPYGLPISGQPIEPRPRTAEDVLAEIAGIQDPQLPEPGQFQVSPFEGFLEKLGSVGLPDIPPGGGGFSDFLGGLTGTLAGRGQQIAAQRAKFQQQSDAQRAARNAANLEASRERRRRLFEELNGLRSEERAVAREDRAAAQRRAEREAENNPRAIEEAAYRRARGAARAERDFPNPRTAAGGAVKPPTAEQQKATAFYTRASAAEANLNKNGLEDRIAKLDPINQYGLRGPTALQSPDQRQYNQAKRAFAVAVLRKDSGATITKDELDSVDKQYFVQPGDDPDTIAQKRADRQVALESLRTQGGPQTDATGAATGAAINPASFWRP